MRDQSCHFISHIALALICNRGLILTKPLLTHLLHPRAMPAPTLGKLDRARAFMKKRQVSPAGPVASIAPLNECAPISKEVGDGDTQKTESVHSDEADPASSGIFSATIPKFNLERTFPSILVPISLLRLAAEANDLDRMRSLAQVFTSCLHSIIHSMDQLPYDVRLNPTYEMAQYGVVFTDGLFTSHLTNIDPKELSGVQVVESIEMALELMDMTIAGLKHFMEIVERVLTENKPLPALPAPGVAEFVATIGAEPVPEPETLATILAEVLEAAGSTPMAYSEPGHGKGSVSERVVIPTPNPRRARKQSILRRVLHRAGNGSQTSLQLSSSSATLVDVPTIDTGDTPKKQVQPERPREIQYTVRQSALFYLADPYSPEVDVEMPLPTGQPVAVRLDHRGEMKAASLTALVRILTSKEAVTNPAFTKTFFMCFRFFSSPKEFFEHLVERFDEQPQVLLTPPQMRVWAREAMHVRIRVVKTVIIWLEEYWRPEMDMPILDFLIAFTFERIVGKLPEQLALRIIKDLDRILSAKDSRGYRERRQMEIRNISLTIKQAPPTDFDILLDPEADFSLQISTFTSQAGREELARQLTIRASNLFLTIDPEDAVIFWRNGADKSVGDNIEAIITLERSISLWVTDFILKQDTQRGRADVIGFWLDVATICSSMRNFSGAFAIFTGVVNPSVNRMKQTILQVAPPHKAQFGELEILLSGHTNQIKYREALSKNEMPGVPLISTLIHDILAVDAIPAEVGLNDTSVEKNLINLHAYSIIMKTVAAMEVCQIPYKLAKSEYIQSWLEDELKLFHPNLEEELSKQFHIISQQLEAKDQFLARHSVWLWTMSTLLNDYAHASNPKPLPAEEPAVRGKVRKAVGLLGRLF